MANCITCGRHYFLSAFNQTRQCDSCLDVIDDLNDITEEDEISMNNVVNKTNRTIPHMNYDGYEYDSHGI